MYAPMAQAKPPAGKAPARKSSAKGSSKLPAVTIVIEWENAIDVEDKWTQAAMSALEAELAAVGPKMSAKPRIMYLYDKNSVAAGTIERTLAATAPRIRELADLEIVPTDGLTYYKLKNFGIARSKTEISIMLDSGFTVLGYDDFLSKTFALSWIFDLKSERDKTVKREKIHANNCAVRTEWFKKHPFPDLPAFKKQCGFWIRDFTARGFKYTRTAEAMTVHAPHPGYKFLAWRAWTMGLDRDYQAFQTGTRSRIGRFGYSFEFFGGKVGKSWGRIIAKGGQVDLPVWQRPAAMAVSLGFYGVSLVAEIGSALTRRFEPAVDECQRVFTKVTAS
jgi:hypothetical protein